MRIRPQASILTQFQKFVSRQEPLKVLMVAPEVSPYANVGGVARVAAHLASGLVKMGHDVRIFMPKFGLIDEEKYPMERIVSGLKVPTDCQDGKGEPFLVCNVKSHTTPNGVKAYFLENMEYYEKRANVYSYSDDPLRWALLCRGALEFIKTEEFVPEVIHVNDWQSGLVANFLRTAYDKDKKLFKIATLLTIHNLHFQGMFDHRNASELDFDDGQSKIACLFEERLNKQNFLRRGIMYSDLITTVSESYAREIMTSEYGEGLDRLLLEIRSKVFGVTNGIDYDEFNPETDPNIPFNYNFRNLEERVSNKIALQREFGLKEDPKIPIIAAEGRLDSQKGLDMAIGPLTKILEMYDVQFIALGGGDLIISESLKELKNKFPSRVGLHLMPNFSLPRLVFAGSDMMIFPSRFEPCGLVQMEGMRYGAIPIARAVGGLADTVEPFDAEADTGVGFVFKDFDPWQFFGSLVRSLETFKHKEIWQGIVKRAMQKNFSWDASAKEYSLLYEKAIKLRNQQLVIEGQITPDEV